MPNQKQTTALGDLVTKTPELTLADLCLSCDLSEELITTYVSEGIIEPQGSNKMKWRFSRIAIIQVHRARRLENDLGLNAAGVALALELMEQNTNLKHKLLRYKQNDAEDFGW